MVCITVSVILIEVSKVSLAFLFVPTLLLSVQVDVYNQHDEEVRSEGKEGHASEENKNNNGENMAVAAAGE